MAGRVGEAALLVRAGRVLRLHRTSAEPHDRALRLVQVRHHEVQVDLEEFSGRGQLGGVAFTSRRKAMRKPRGPSISIRLALTSLSSAPSSPL